ncbi:MAG: 3-deoxy-D-manno-octulosonic acid transferase [Draconibacterium sp.]|nr:3-deoxy-D-manno-octulosonic acid transferase [Draconibacterium sp.]
MRILYKIGIFLYSLTVHFGSFFNKKAGQFVKGRKNWEANLQNQIEKSANYIWFHCASLGEFEQGRPVIEEVKKQFPHYKIILTFFSPSGYEIRKNYDGADIILYLPLDTKSNAQTFINIVKPEKAFFIKYEFWYFYINELKRQNIPLYIISAIFRENQQFFKNTILGKWYKQTLFKFEHFFVQNETSAKLLKSIGIKNISVAGDTRFDRVATIVKAVKKYPIVEKFKENKQLIIAGSTWKPDEELLIKFINQNEDIKFIIAPHEVSDANINRIHQLLKKPAISFSKITEKDINDFQVLIIDSIGLLSSLYQHGSIAYIGGGFGVGIHNILEAATFGTPIVFGPNFKKFNEAKDLISNGGAFSITNYNELKNTFNRLISDKKLFNNSSKNSKNYVKKNVGSTKFIINKVFNNVNLLD